MLCRSAVIAEIWLEETGSNRHARSARLLATSLSHCSLDYFISILQEVPLQSLHIYKHCCLTQLVVSISFLNQLSSNQGTFSINVSIESCYQKQSGGLPFSTSSNKSYFQLSKNYEDIIHQRSFSWIKRLSSNGTFPSMKSKYLS